MAQSRYALVLAASASSLTMLFALPNATTAAADTFYQGKTITLLVGYPPAGAPDTFMRLVSRHFAQHVPGNPAIVVQNMGGAGSLKAANYMAQSAPRDGTVLALLAPTLPLEERLGSSAARYKSKELAWIGRMATAPNVTFIMNTSAVKTIKDASDHVAILGATGRASTNFIYPNVMNSVLGTKFNIVAGYPGTADVMLAMDRGEVEGNSATYDGLMNQHPDWVKTKRVNIVVQYLLTRDPELQDVPTMVELARTDEERKILRAVSTASEFGKFLLTSPEVPADRIETLRRAFDAMVKDPEYIADAQGQRIGLNPLNGEGLQNLVEEVADLSPDITEKVKKIYPLN
jgi:tripartite-type tricarboxylate transporter receptor subunit TctC